MGQRPYRLVRTCWGNRVEIPDKGHYCNARAKPEYPACFLEWQTVNPGCALYSMPCRFSNGTVSVLHIGSVSTTIQFDGRVFENETRLAIAVRDSDRGEDEARQVVRRERGPRRPGTHDAQGSARYPGSRRLGRAQHRAQASDGAFHRCGIRRRQASDRMLDTYDA